MTKSYDVLVHLLILSCTLAIVFAAATKPAAAKKPAAATKPAAGKKPAAATKPGAAKSGAKGSTADFEKEAIKKIGALAGKLAEDAFSFDPILFQFPDKVNSATKYKIPDEKQEGQDIYSRKVDDSNKETIVLSTAEDFMEWKNKKRVYIVLKKNTTPKSKHSEYYVAVAYLRDAGDKDKDSLKIAGGSYNVEWDLWDDHFVPGGSTMTLNSIFCTSSVILPCLFSDAPIEDGKDGIIKAAKRYEPKKTVSSDNINMTIEVDTGNSDDSYDMYRDIDGQRLMEGRGYTTSYNSDDGNPGLLGAVGQGVSGIVCAVFGGCGSRSSSSSSKTTTVDIDLGQAHPQQQPYGYNPYGYTAAAAPAYYGTPGYMSPGPGMAVYGRRKRDEGAAVPASTANMLNFPGWKTQYVTPEKGIYLKHESLPFYGFGNCPSKPLTEADLENAKTGEQLVDYYLTILRSDCVEILKKQLLKLLEIEALLVKDKTLVINSDVKKAGNPKFTLHEAIFSQTALEMDAFTTSYIKLLHDKEAEKPTTPDGSAPISRSVNVALHIYLSMVDTSRETGRLHMIAKTRHAITGARYAFSKLVQDEQNMAGCSDCEEDLKLNKGDKVAIMGLIQFLKYGLRDVDLHTGKDATSSFKTFFTKNKDFIEAKVNLYS